MLVLTVLVLARARCHDRPRLSLRRERQHDAAARLIAAAGVVMLAAAVAGTLRARRSRASAATPTCRRRCGAAARAGIDLARPRAAQPEPRALGRARCGSGSIAWTGRANAFPEAVGSLSLVALAVIAAAWWRFGWQAVADPRRRHGLLRPARARPLRPRRRRQHADPDAVERAALRADPRAGAIAGPLRGARHDRAWRCCFAQALAHLGRSYPERRRPILRGRRRAPGDRAGARAAHALLGRDPRALPDDRPRPAAQTSGCSSCRSA